MAFPTSPTNGQQTTINGVVYTYSSALTAWTVTSSGGSLIASTSVSATGNVTSGNLITDGVVSATGSVTGRGSMIMGNAVTGNTLWSVNDQNGILVQEYGRTDGTASSPAFDFHSGATAVDYDSRMQASGGTGVTGGGTLTITSAVFSVSGNVVSSKIAPVGNLVINAANVVTAATFSNTGAYLTLPAGNATVAPLDLTSGTLTTTPDSGAVEFANTTLYFSTASGNRGAVTSSHFYRLASNVTLANVATAQSWLGVGVSLQANTTYAFNGQFSLVTTGTTSHTEATGFGGTATLTNIGVLTTRGNANAITATTGNVYSVYRTSNASTVQTGAFTTAQNCIYQLNGTVSINAAGTFIPQLTFSAAPAGVSTVVLGSYFQIYPLGPGNGNLSIGNWA